MRISGCLTIVIGVVVFGTLMGVCAFTSYSLTQQTVVDLNASGFQVDDPLETLRCALTGRCEGLSERPPLNAPLLVLTPLFGPVATDVPRQSTVAAVDVTLWTEATDAANWDACGGDSDRGCGGGFAPDY